MNAARFVTVALAVVLLAARPLEAAPRLPNIVVIFTDDQGYADVGCFGATGFATPNLDRLASEGRKFTSFHVAQPVCSASRTGLLTGCYPNRLGIHGALGPTAMHGISDREVTLAQLLKQKGYATGMAGKWHLGHHPQFLPTRHGFDEYLGLPYSNDMWPRHPEAKPGSYPPLPMIDGETIVDPDVSPDDQRQLTTRYTDRAVSFIERHKDVPFFFYLAHSMPHVPLHVSEKFRGKSKQGLYGDVIMELDWSVGEVLKALKTHDLERDTLVIFTTDNGPWLSYGEHAGSASPLREGKGTCWEGGVRVPCIMRWPGKIPAGTTCDAMLMTIDLFPTIARLVGAQLPAHPIDGRDVWPILAGEPGARNPHDAYLFYYEVNQLQAVASGDGRWKLQLPHTYRTLSSRPGGRDGAPAKYEQRTIVHPELYDLAHDVSETTDVADKNPEVVRKLLVVAEQARADLGDALTKREGRGVRPAGRLSANVLAPGATPRLLQKEGAGEGPAWHPELGLLTSGGVHIYRRSRDGEVSIYRRDTGSNGLLFDHQGRLVMCEAANRRVTRIEKDGRLTILADRYDGKRFNQPNDLAIDSLGRLYFSDPCYGDRGGMELVDERGRKVEGVYRIDPDGKVTRVIAFEVERPNGLVVSHDGRTLFVADNHNDVVGGARKLWRFELKADGSVNVAGKTLVHDWGATRGPDGVKLDAAGRLFVAAGLNAPNPPFETQEKPTAGVYVFSPEGRLLTMIPIPRDECTNCAFGGDDFKTLFITAGGTLWSVRVVEPGRPL
jgi:arylsulfatase A